jgi:hypothetical protein
MFRTLSCAEATVALRRQRMLNRDLEGVMVSFELLGY